jgi:hypothetical protein
MITIGVSMRNVRGEARRTKRSEEGVGDKGTRGKGEVETRG